MGAVPRRLEGPAIVVFQTSESDPTMQVTETLSQGLKREFKVVLPATELEQRLTSELATLKDRVRINGFRPGKVPVQHLRRLYGRSVMADVVQNAVNEANRKIVDDNNLKLALEPQVQFPENKEEVDQALDAKADLAFTVALEVLPSFELADLSDVTIKKLTAAPSDADLQEALERLAKQNRGFTAKGEGAEAALGDRVVIDFVGKIDGTPFEGGKGEGAQLDLGSGSFIPGFEDQLVGARAGEQRQVKVTFPEAYQAQHLAGKAAEFDVMVKEVQAPNETKIDDDLAKGLGMESLDKLRTPSAAPSSAISTRSPAASSRRSCLTPSTPNTASSCRRASSTRSSTASGRRSSRI
jgi:trigger factor